MAQIVPKLNLNKTPSLVESNSLIFAKNIRLDVDGTIHRDYGIMPMSVHKGNNTKNTVNYKNLLSRIISDIEYDYTKGINTEDHYLISYNWLKWISGETINTGSDIIKDGEASIVGIIADSNDFYIFLHGTCKYNEDERKVSLIIKYSERDDRFSPCNCAWSYSGGEIDGCVVNNLIGDKILNIGETNIGTLVPLKSINLNTSSITDDENIYTQVPNIPITNLTFADTFSAVIPNGVYQFFVRYRIRKDFYTDWFPASHDIFVGNKNSVITSFGTLQYVNTHRDSDNSFVLAVEHLIDNNKGNYDGFQIGFILSHDDAIYARAWKHFSFNITSINFDYKASDAEEIEVIDLLKTTYGLYNVGNITSFKNKLYISNYTESNFNEDLQSIANDIQISIKTKEGGNTYDGYPIITTNINNKQVISGLRINETDRLFYGDSGIFKEIMESSSGDYISLSQAITNALNNSETIGRALTPDLYGIRVIDRIDTLRNAQNDVSKTYKNVSDSNHRLSYSFSYGNNAITGILFNGVSISKDNVVKRIYSTQRYLNDNCKWITSNGSVNDKITIRIARKCEVTESYWYSGSGGFQPYNPSLDYGLVDPLNDEHASRAISRPDTDLVGGGTNSGSTSGTRHFSVTYYQDIEIEFYAWSSKLNKNDSSTLINNTTLIPYQKYKFYIHFVKDSGETTNGYYCSNAGELEAPYSSSCIILYPEFKNIKIPTGYKACFFSICHTAVNSASIFNIADAPNGTDKEGTCFDINMMLVPGNRKIHIKQGTKESGGLTPTNPILPETTAVGGDITIKPTTTVPVETLSGQYYYSGDASSGRYFGGDGVVTFDKDNFDNDKLAYAITNYSISETDNIELIKCTPFLTLNSAEKVGTKYVYADNSKMNLLGYICDVSPLLRDRCLQYYSDGSSIYYKDSTTYGEDTGLNLRLDELYKYNDSDISSDKKLSNFGLRTSVNKIIYSNYNLNYVALSEDPKMAIKTYYNRAANATTTSSEKDNIGNSILLRLIPSQLMSDIYTLPNMYKSYPRKTYSIYKENETNVFNNTVRSSILYGDENKINILTFDANDYYNIPTNRGKIINLVSVGDVILVHTRDSMFKFSGSNTLSSSNGEILTNESKPFDTGVSEVFGSDFGFAGIQYKSDHIITENGYIFFDRDSRIVYMYSGQGQIVKISESIEKLFRHRNIDHIIFANDYYNNRFFMSIMFCEDYTTTENGQQVIKQRYYPATLSFNINEQIKSFVSLHDFYYHYAFNTKTKCYFLSPDNKDICTIDKIYLGTYSKLELTNDKLYPQNGNYIWFKFVDEDTEDAVIKTNSIKTFYSIVDIIDNNNYETIKSLNAVNWCGNKIDTEFQNINTSDPKTLLMAEDVNLEIPCKYIRIYSDSCTTPLNDCTYKSNNYSIDTATSYKYPRYNQGIWTFNYFRNILNSKGHTTMSNYDGDNNSLIEGKYFVVRFIFDEAFKLETLSLNYNYKQ